MSLLEDVFLEDEAGEAQDLERIIEGDEFDDRPRSRADDSDENSAKEDEAEEEKVRVDPTNAKPKRVIKNPRFVLNPARLTGPRGIQVLPEHFKGFNFKGKGHEKSDLDLVLKKLEHWAYRLYPKFQFEDCLKKIETLGKKRAVAVHLTKLRMDMLTSDETVVQKDSSGDEAQGPSAPEEQDEFDKLLQQQIEIARATPAPTSVKKTPLAERASFMTKATSSPSINDEQRERMLRNRQMAEERRLAKLKQNKSQENGLENELTTVHFTTNVNVNSGEKDVTNDAKRNENDVVELDDNGIVVSSSHIPAKKHNQSGVESANFIAIDKDNTQDIMEIDNNAVTKSVRTYVPAKKHRSTIDSSDDEASEPVIVDVENHHNNPKNLKSNTNNNKADIADSSHDENITELITIDVENHNSGRTKKPNVIDSSDDDEPLVMNESITVDVHRGNNNETNIKKQDNSNISEINSNEKEINVNDSVFDTLIAKDSGNNNIVDDSELDSVQNNFNFTNASNNSKSETNKPAETVQSSDENKVSQIDEDEKLMDVDLGDDF